MNTSGGRETPKPKQGSWTRSGIRAVAGGIGLVSESFKSYRPGKSKDDESEGVQPAPIVQSEPQSSTDNTSLKPEAGANAKAEEQHEDLENEWNLDEAQEEAAAQPPESPKLSNGHKNAEEFVYNNNPSTPTPEAERPRLAHPVVLPQRRPKERSRGFIRAYAPVLQDCDISQEAWLEFLERFQKSSAANPWLNCINFAALAAMKQPQPIGIAVGLAVGEITEVVMEMQARQRTNRFLHQVNEDFFRPRGLYCLLMTYDPNTHARVKQVNLASIVAQDSKPSTGIGTVQKTFRSSDGTTYNDWEFPETAPLVFPGLDQLAANNSGKNEQEKGIIAKKYGFVADYWDRRATAAYAIQHPDNALSKFPEQKFKSRYADPNHPASSGSLIALATGGRLVPGPESRGLVGGLYSVADQAVRGVPQGTGKGKQYYDQKHGEQSSKNPYSKNYREDWEEGGSYTSSGMSIGPMSTPIGLYKRYLKQNILYLMVVNMPSEDEIASAMDGLLPQ